MSVKKEDIKRQSTNKITIVLRNSRLMSSDIFINLSIHNRFIFSEENFQLKHERNEQQL